MAANWPVCPEKAAPLLGLTQVSHQSSTVFQFWVDEALQRLAGGDPDFAAGEKDSGASAE